MDITGYQAVTVEMVLKVRRAWQAGLGHMVLKGKLDQKALILITETGNSVRGRKAINVTLAFYR